MVKEKELVDSILGDKEENTQSTDMLPSLSKLKHNDPLGPKLNIKLNDLYFSPRQQLNSNTHLLSQLLQSSKEKDSKGSKKVKAPPISVRLDKLDMPSTSRVARKR